MGNNSCPTSHLFSSPRGGREAGGGGEEVVDCVDLPSLPSKRHLLLVPFLAKERQKETKPEILSIGGEDAPLISSRN